MNSLFASQQRQGESDRDQIDFSLNHHAIVAPDVPGVFTLELTTACNNFCSGCANTQLAREKGNRKDSLVFMKDWKIVIDKIAPFAKIIRLSGGEPTLHPDFFEIVNYIDNLNIPHALFSTGIWNNFISNKLFTLYKKCNAFVGMLVSLHGSNSFIHNTFVENTERTFKITCQNIQLASGAGFEIFTNTVITNYNYNEIYKIIQLSNLLGSKYSIFNRFLGNDHPIEPTSDQLRSAIIQIDELRMLGHKCRFGNNIPPCFVTNSSEGAKAGYTLCHIDPRGFVRPDNLIDLNFGNVYHKSLQDIWKSPVALMYRSSFPKTCLTCAAFSDCKAGAKSVTLQYGLQQDKLMCQPLDRIVIDGDDVDKKNIRYLALTSD